MALSTYLHPAKSKGGLATSGARTSARAPAPKKQAPAKPVGPRDTFEAKPRDAASGLPTGKRMHKPFVVTVEASVTAPRDAVSGNSTGRRQHKPVTFTATRDSVSGNSTGRRHHQPLESVASPRDPASGLATGKRTHKPVR